MVKKYVEEDEKKLPIWVQNRLNTLRMRVIEVEEKYGVCDDSSPLCKDAKIRLAVGLEKCIPLPNNSVEFCVNGDEIYSAKFCEDFNGREFLHIVSTGGSLFCMPVAGNVVHIYARNMFGG